MTSEQTGVPAPGADDPRLPWWRILLGLVPRLAVLLGADAMIGLGWIHLGLRRVALDLLVVLPVQLLLLVALLGLRRRWQQAAFCAVVLAVSYAQYAFWSFYGRFLGAAELRLAAANAPREVLESIELYFSLPALVAALAMTGAYVLVLRPPRPPVGGAPIVLAALAGVLAWGVSWDLAAPLVPIHSPLPAFATTELRWLRQRVSAHRSVKPGRLEPPAPTAPSVPFDVLYLVGESIRADRLNDGAYGRDVAPGLHALALPRVSFTNVTSHGDCTGRSVPMLMVEPSAPIREDLYRRPTLFAYARRAGFHTAFINSNENDWHEFIDPNIELVYRNVDPAPGEDNWTFRTDAGMLPVIERVANTPGRQFLVVETYTSHWPYGDRYESCAACRVYRPDLVHRSVPFAEVNRPRITNSYDNAILYFDRFVTALLSKLTKPTLVVLTSDHGESLGEDGRWGHCSAGPEQMFVPLMLIATDAAVARAAGFDELERHKDLPVAHANVMPTLLRWFGYDPARLDFPYAQALSEVPMDAAPRRVLVSEYGDEVSAVTFGLVDRQRQLLRQELVPNR